MFTQKTLEPSQSASMALPPTQYLKACYQHNWQRVEPYWETREYMLTEHNQAEPGAA